MFFENNKIKLLISLPLTVVLVVSTFFIAFGAEEVLAEQAANSKLEQEQIEDLTLPVDSTADDSDYDGYIVKIEDNKLGKIDEDSVEDYDSTADNEFVLVEDPEDALDFVDPDYVEFIEPNYIRKPLVEGYDEIDSDDGNSDGTSDDSNGGILKDEDIGKDDMGKDDADGTNNALSLEGEDEELTILTTKDNINEYNLIHAFDAWAHGYSGKGVTVAVFDTGLTINHPGFAKTTTAGPFYNFVNLQNYIIKNSLNQYVYGNIPTGLDKIKDGYKTGHGTPVAGLIAAKGEDRVQGIAYDSSISAAKIMSDGGYGSTFDFIYGLDYYWQSNKKVAPDVLNMSFGGTAYSQAEYLAIKNMTDTGTIAIAASGNDRQKGSPYNYPANYENVIGVGSVNTNKVVSYFSTSNHSVLVAAPGNGIKSLSNSGTYVSCYGTSFASPVVAGTAALAAEFISKSQGTDKKFNQHRFLTLIKSTSTEASTAGYDVNTGYGIVNVDKLVTQASASGINTPKSYKIVYKANGGKITGPMPTIHTEGTATALSKKVSRTGYNFSHWINESKKKVTSIPSDYSPVAGDDGHMTLTAVWTPKTYYIKYHGNGGRLNSTKKYVKYNTAIGTLSVPKTRKGYNFLGWYTAKKGGSQYYKGRKYTKAGNMTLYARWTKSKVLRFNANGGNVKWYAKAITRGKKYGTLPTPTRSGYKFLGWYTKKSGGKRVTANTKAAKKANYTIYAHWKKK